jgi:nucleotide-binding universal stress UspA family protein
MFNCILCVLNATHHADEVLTHAVHIAQKNEASLHILLALESLPPSASMVMESASYLDSQRSIESQAKSWLDDKVTQWNEQYPVSAKVTMGSPIDDIQAAIKEIGAKLVIRHTEDSILDALIGTDDVHLIHASPCPVLVTHHTLPHDYKRIVVAVDANYHYAESEVEDRKRLNQSLVDLAGKVSAQENAELTIVSVYDVYPSALLGDGFISVPMEILDDEAESIENEQSQIMQELVETAKLSVTPKVMVKRGNARIELPDIAKQENADLVIMGTVARVGIPGLLIGNTVASVISNLDCAVLAVKPEQA